MSHLRVLICRVDDENPDQMTELSRFDIPDVDPETISPDTTLDDLERSTRDVGYAVLRKLFQARWEALDERLAEAYRQRFSP